MNISVGADPEFFLMDTKLNRYISAHDKVPGNKQVPHKLRYGAVQADGTAVEFNINPAKTSKQFVDNINRTLKTIRNRVPKRYAFVYKPSIVFDEVYFEKEVPEKAKEFGCDPDYNCYNYDVGKPNPKPVAREYASLRTGAGHIHIGFTNVNDPIDKNHIFDCKVLVKNLDKYFQYFSTFWDTDRRRANLYGRAGDFRPKKYGLEYRTLSNAWLNHPELWPWIFESVKWIVEQTKKGVVFGNVYKKTQGFEACMIQVDNKGHLKYRDGYHHDFVDHTKYLPWQSAPKFPLKYNNNCKAIVYNDEDFYDN